MPTNLPAVIKGSADYRTYRPLKLDNGMTILLVHDKQSKNFAASVSVAVGASSDPRLLPGIAHFTEHMCFLGSKAYPEENEYKQYLAKNGGKSNASTSMSHVSCLLYLIYTFSTQNDILPHIVPLLIVSDYISI